MFNYTLNIFFSLIKNNFKTQKVPIFSPQFYKLLLKLNIE